MNLVYNSAIKDYVMTAGKWYESCGLRGGHAYSLITAFNMTDNNQNIYNMFILRDPWGTTDFNEDWNDFDSRWTPDMIAQIPNGISPFNSSKTGFIFMDV